MEDKNNPAAVHKCCGLSGRALTIAQTLLVVLPSFIIFGYNQSGLGGLIGLEDWVKTFPTIDTVHTKGAAKSHNSTIQGLVVSIHAIGALFGALSCSWTGDKYGRRAVIFGAAILTTIGQVLECSSFVLTQFFIGRFILGAGVGMLSATVPVWQSESSSGKNRGKHVVLDGMFISIGYALESWINLGFFTYKTGPITWRPPLAIPLVFSFLVLGTTYLFPESPRWLMAQNRAQEARQALSALKGLPGNDPTINAEITGIEISLEETSTNAASFKDLFHMGEDKIAYRFGLCILLQFFQQLSGTNLISVYSTIIYQEGLGLDAFASRAMTGGTMTWKALSCLVAFLTIDRFGRRAVFMISGGGMASCMIALAIANSFPKENYTAQITAAFFVYLFCFFTPIGFLGANYLYCTEVAPTRLRVAMASISTANHWLWNFVVAMITPVAIADIGYRYYIVYAVIGMCIPVTIYFFYPETMGRSLEELDIIFRDSPSWFATVRYEKHRPHITENDVPFSKTEEEKLEKV